MLYNFRIIILYMGQYKRISGFFIIISAKGKKSGKSKFALNVVKLQ